MKGRVAGLTAIVVAAGGMLAAQELWPLPAGTASAAAGRVTQVSLPAAGLAALPVCPGPQSLVVPEGGAPSAAGGRVVVGAAVESPGGGGAGRPATLAGMAMRDAGAGYAVRDLSRTSAGLVTLQVPKAASVPAMSATQVTLTRSGDARGVAALACPTTATQTWLVGGGTQTGRRGRLVLANPAATPAVADVTVYGPRGVVRTTDGAGTAVPAHGVRALFVDALAPGLDALAVLVQARSGRVSASLQDTYVRGLTPGGTDDVTAAAPPARRQVVPGVSVASPVGVPLPRSASAAGAVAVRVVNPQPTETVARVRLLGEDGAADLDGGVLTLAPGEVRDVPVTGVAAGVYAAEVEADAPVVAGAVVGRVTGGAAAGAGERPADFGWAASAEPLAGTALLALPGLAEGTAPVATGRILALSAPDRATSVEVTELDGEGRPGASATLAVRAGATTRCIISAKAAAVRLRPADPAAGVTAALVLHVPDPAGPMISVLPVRPVAASADGRPYAVSDVRTGLR